MELHQFINLHPRTIRQVQASFLLLAVGFLAGAFQRNRERIQRFIGGANE